MFVRAEPDTDLDIPALDPAPTKPPPRPIARGSQPPPLRPRQLRSHPVRPHPVRTSQLPPPVRTRPVRPDPDRPAIAAAAALPDVPVRLVTAVEPPAAPRRRPVRARLIALSAAAAFAIGATTVAAPHIARMLSPQPVAITALEPSEPAIDKDVPARMFVRAIEDSRARHRRSAPYRDLWRVDTWYHPLTGELLVPERDSRKFGAERSGRRPAECGRGHCGIDVGEFGMPVNAVRDGIVERVQRRSRSNAGRYVRIAHDNGYVSYYMHLHRVASGLEKGMQIRGGDPIGTVGRTGIKRSQPHLHFSLAYRKDGKNIYIDPEPLLRRSMLAGDETLISSGHSCDGAQSQ